VLESERDAFYEQIHIDPALAARQPGLALRRRTPTGLEHFVRVRFPTLLSWGGWPTNIQFNITDEELDTLATEKPGVLLCQRLWESSVSGSPMRAQPPAAPSASPATPLPVATPAPLPATATPLPATPTPLPATPAPPSPAPQATPG
jgi:hypothetical protein